MNRLDYIDAYMQLVRHTWEIRLDHEDGSTAPFTAHAVELVEASPTVRKSRYRAVSA